jgi:hypothetical protein
MTGYYFVPGEQNLADLLRKHREYAQVWPLLKTLICKEDTDDIAEQHTINSGKKSVSRFVWSG